MISPNMRKIKSQLMHLDTVLATTNIERSLKYKMDMTLCLNLLMWEEGELFGWGDGAHDKYCPSLPLQDASTTVAGLVRQKICSMLI